MNLNYNQDDGRPRQSGDRPPVPAGIYILLVVKIGSKAPKSGGTPYLSAELEIMEGEHAGRKLWDAFFLWHEGIALDLSRDKFDDLAKACGQFPIKNTDALVDCTCSAQVVAGEGQLAKNK